MRRTAPLMLAGVYPSLFFSAALSLFIPATAQSADGEPVAQAQTAQEHTVRRQADPLLEFFRRLTPEQKKKLLENIQTWQQISPDFKQALRDRDLLLRKKFKDEVDAALGETPFSPEQRAQFEEKYREERKKVEAALRAEMEPRRKAAMEDAVQRLKKAILEPPQPEAPR